MNKGKLKEFVLKILRYIILIFFITYVDQENTSHLSFSGNNITIIQGVLVNFLVLFGNINRLSIILQFISCKYKRNLIMLIFSIDHNITLN